MLYSIIVPVYNRPEEMRELLESLSKQSEKNFEIIVVEDGSSEKSEDLVQEYVDRLKISYFYKENEKPAVARNYGAARAQGDYFIFFDSDCIIPENYFSIINKSLSEDFTDAYGGPDASHEEFNSTQKAVSYAMTSFFTTGGIRGGKETIDKFYPRSFNMGISRKAFFEIGGFPVTQMHPGEDMVFSIEIVRRGFKTKLIREARVWHKRRNTMKSFFRQVRLFGRTRAVISKFYPETYKIHFWAPSVFVGGTVSLILLGYFSSWFLLPLAFYATLIFVDSFLENLKITVAALSVYASFIQLFGYGIGFADAMFQIKILKKIPYSIPDEGFYISGIKDNVEVIIEENE